MSKFYRLDFIRANCEETSIGGEIFSHQLRVISVVRTISWSSFLRKTSGNIYQASQAEGHRHLHTVSWLEHGFSAHCIPEDKKNSSWDKTL